MNASDRVCLLHPRPQLFMLGLAAPQASRHVLDRHKFPGGRPPYKSNFYCHPGRAGGTPMLLAFIRPRVGVQEPGITRYGFRRFDGTHSEYCAPRHQDAENPATARKANDQARALMVEADAVLAQEVALSGTLCLWLALVSHAQAAQRSTGKSLRCHRVRSLHVGGS